MSRTHIFAVAGHPVLHSKSPLLFNKSFQKLKEKAVYTRISTESASEAVTLFEEIGLSGLNVTAPLKQAIIDQLDELEPAASVIGAVNAVLKERGVLKGSNTDPLGVTASLKSLGLSLQGRHCVVLGAGGAGKAAAYGLVREGARVFLVNRTYRKAVLAAEKLGCDAVYLDELPSLMNEANIVVSALAPRINLIRKEWLHPAHVVLDANYPHSPLQNLARAQGCTYIPGEAWLLNQAIPAYKLFTGKEADRAIMERALSFGFGTTTRRNNISLVGFMGCGKSTAGLALAKKLGYSFKDVDAVIEEREGKTIPEIFHLKGEERFRSLEKSVLAEIEQERRTVYACGGGAVSDPENRSTLRSNSRVIWLYAALGACLQRIDPRSRPLLDKEGRGEKTEELFRKRLPLYAQAADLVVSSEKKPEQTAETIYEEIHHTLGD